MNLKALFLLLVSALALNFAGGASSRPEKGTPLVCKLEGLFDSQSNQNAYTYFVPKGWAAHSELKWGRDPGSYEMKISASTPDDQYEVTQFGNDVYQFKLMRGIRGEVAMVVNSPVHHATEYLRVVLHQIAQAKGFSDAEVVDEVNAPIADKSVPLWLKNAFVPPGETRIATNETGYLQVKFNGGGRSQIAMLGTTVKGFHSTTQLPGKNGPPSEGGFYMVGPTTMLIMPADASTQKQREMKLIIGSVKMTPQFHGYLANLIDHLVKIKIGAYAEAQKYNAETFHERSMAQFNEQMHMRDAYSNAFCKYISDLQDFKDQTGRTVTAPSSVSVGWSDGHGNYLFNDDPTVDLRGFGDGNWKQMQKARIGE